MKTKRGPLYIGVDFDGTCTTHEFPSIGRDIGAVPVLKELIENGHKLILFTMRCDDDTNGKYLESAVRWFKDNGVPLYGIQRNPTQGSWTSSPKAYCHLYIDDAGLGIPLVYPDGERPYVDWKKVRKLLQKQEIL